jgi:hypothetical protein
MPPKRKLQHGELIRQIKHWLPSNANPYFSFELFNAKRVIDIMNVSNRCVTLPAKVLQDGGGVC